MSVDNAQRAEMTRILEMVQSGRVTPEEGERLLASLEQRAGPRRRCPYCAEDISAQAVICPECNSALETGQTRHSAQRTGHGFHSLTGLGKFLVCYTFMVCGLVWVFGIAHFPPRGISSMLLALLGIVAAVLICRGSRAGWVLGIIWAAAQIVPIIVNNTVLNRQILLVGNTWTTNGDGAGFNVVGLVLMILFIRAMPSEI